jgi:hypothetical protein
VITESSIIKDEFVDDAMALIKVLNSRKGWNEEAKLNQEKLQKLLLSKGYIWFSGGFSRYIISKIGDSYLYDVPMYKRGHLSKFKGKRVRIVCVSSGTHTYREYMAGVVSETPPEKLITKLERRYSFPDTGNHTVIYSSPRFKIIKVDGDSKIATTYDASGYVDLELCDAILLDGKKGIPIATLIYKSETLKEGKIIGWKLGREYDSIKDAIIELKKRSDRYHEIN